MKKRQLRQLDEDQIKDLHKAVEEKREIKKQTRMAHKKVIFKKNYTLTEKQKEIVRMVLDPEVNILFIEGAPGVSKTFVSLYAALKLYDNKEVEKIYLTKPIVQVGDPLGFLPGSKEEKVSPYLESFMTNFDFILESSSLTGIMNNNDIEFKIVQFMRGANYESMVLIVDEMQNFSIKELMTIVTRLNKNSKIIFLGDTRQADINKKYSAVSHFKKILDVEGVKFFKFENSDNMRHPMLVKIVDNYDKYIDEMPESKNNA